jgi:aryl-alcohol dehydrogenase-like predicted oxidoreductase
VFTESPDSEEA